MAAETQDKISVLSFGAGAIGTYIGGSLAHHQHRVVFLERPAEVQPLREHGLKIKLEDQTIALDDPLVVGSLEEALALGPFDLALFAMKAYDTVGALQEIAPFESQMPPILCLQNGVSNEAAIAAVLGKDRVIAATVTSAIERRAVGDIILQRLRGMGVAATHPLSARLVNALNDAGLNARMYSHAVDMKWSKMLTNLLANASSAILDMTPEEIFAHP
ncbi:MAG TPA: 2-dehydropantoate 2-reductase N-terminal domain-containing protein, partial [Anaerolineales bacterium]|nr:2-dehydropantoate 2-reductase N-terminal domain-containing protein [Anaerolineales bacterium]